ncbi:MAG: DUF1624 domain-containing protein [Proteobacteria bacterium]|nr:DUF1624 domain-containing protein [Desulfobulbaceae bacterium]MBU4153077.1 DUF1624 domain-containing protein [Pseudomonadota bacterium]MDP2106141.1 heparan-alpha-glucosaminide N-acetyltransferase [Desulfobulbaceae bacterium]
MSQPGNDLPPRRWEIDCARGAAVGLMIVSNFLFDLVFFGGKEQLQSSVLDWFARFVAGFFIVLAGISLTLSQARPDSRFYGFGKIVFRGLGLMGLGLVVTGATWFAAGDGMVIFGVLHLIGAGLILVYPFVGHPMVSLVAGVLISSAALWTNEVRLDTSWLLWLGLQPYDFSSVDYAPLIPWLGPMLIGVFLGHMLYPDGNRRYRIADLSQRWPVRVLTWGGRHSLVIYFVHQPVLLAGLFLALKWR